MTYFLLQNNKKNAAIIILLLLMLQLYEAKMHLYMKTAQQKQKKNPSAL
jgi:hypothetical protein